MKRRIRDIFVWFTMFYKRLIYRPAFVILLLMIPLVTVALRFSLAGDTGVLRIGLYSEGSKLGDAVVSDLLSRDSIVSFTEYGSEAEAKNAVMSDKIQGAWIFPKDLEARIDNNTAKGTTEPLAKVIEQKETIPLKLSHELLYGCLHPYVAYSNFEHFAAKKYPDADTSSEALRHHFQKGADAGEVLIMKIVGEEEKAEISSDITSYPIRGILSLLCVLCALASAMYFLSDKEAGRFGFLPKHRHIVPALGSCLAGASLSCVAVFISLILTGNVTDILTEITAMLLYVICVCGFCLVCAALLGSSARLGVMIPFLMILMMVQCPIFVNADMLRPLWFLFPASFYLYAVYNGMYMIYMIIYAAVSLMLAFLPGLVPTWRLPEATSDR